MPKRPGILCVAVLLVFASVCGYAQGNEPKRLNVRDFGAIGEGMCEDGPALNRAVEEGVRHGPGTVIFIPKGRYLLSAAGGGHLTINDARGLTIQGEPGSVLVARNPDTDIVKLSNCTGTVLKQLTLEQQKTYFTQGVVDAMAPDCKSCDVTIGRHYDEPDAPHLAKFNTLRSFSYADTTTYRQDRWWPTVKARTRTGDRKWHFEIEGWALTPDMVKKPFILWDDKHGSHGVNLYGCADCLVEDVTYYGRGTNASLFLSSCPGDVTIRRMITTVPPASGDLLSCSGGGQMLDCRGSLTFEECWLDKVDDDGADIFTGYDRILAQVNPRTLTLQGHRDYRPKDRVAVVDWITRADRHTVSVVSATRDKDDTTTLVVDQDVTVVRTGKGDNKDRTTTSTDGIDRVTNFNLACKSATFRKCRIQALRARGLNLKAQNCLVEDCTFYDCEMPALSGGPELWWGEGPALNTFTVRKNTFINCNTRCVDIAYFDGGVKCVARANRAVLIEGNTFKNWAAHDTIHRGFVPQCPIRIGNATGVIVRNNTFEDAVRSNKPVRILVEKSEKVVIEGNRNLPESSIERR